MWDRVCTQAANLWIFRSFQQRYVDGSCFPLCNLLNNSMTSNDVDRKKKKSENVSGRGTPSSIEIQFYEIMVSRDNDMCYSELLW